MRYWWVNQNQTHRAELRGNFMWSPKTNANGARNQFYENMHQVAPGDIVFSFYDTRIQALGVVRDAAQTAPKPDFGNAGLNWSQEGWFVAVDYCVFRTPLRPKEHIAILRPFLPSKYSPLQVSGDGLQSVYLAEVPEPMADALIGLIGQAYYDCLAVLTAFPSGPDAEATDNIEVEIDIGPTFKEQLGLLLSPHIDHLFDQGYISFSNNEQLLVVPEVRTNLLDKWGIAAGSNVGDFNREQQAFLDYHRANVFKGLETQ